MSSPLLPLSHTENPALLSNLGGLVDVLPAVNYTPRDGGEVDYYGASDCIAHALGLERSLFTGNQASWIHGWSGQIVDPQSPRLLVQDPYKGGVNLVDNETTAKYLREHDYRGLAVGAPLIYADESSPPRRLPDSLLIVPPHSTTYSDIGAQGITLPYVEQMIKLKSRFKHVVACIGGPDVLKGNWIKAFEAAGIPWVCGAWVFDRNGLVRMQRIFRSFEFITTNVLGSHIAYAAYCGCRVVFHGENHELKYEDVVEHPYYKTNPELAAHLRDRMFNDALLEQRFPFLFRGFDHAPDLTEWARSQLGVEHRKPAREIARHFGWKLKARGTQWKAEEPLDMSTNRELHNLALKATQEQRAEEILRVTGILKKRELNLPNVELMRGLAFVQKKNAADARVAFQKELQCFPDNKKAQELLTQLDNISSPPAVTSPSLPKPTSAMPPDFAAFLNPSLEPNNADLYVVRSTILRAVKDALPHFHGTFLDIGCGVMPYKGLITSAPSRVNKYLGLDLAGSAIYHAEVDLRWDGKTIPLPDASVDCAMATEVLEHCPEPLTVLKEARRVLKPGGVFFFTVPFIWPLHDAPYDFFRYTPFALEKLLAEAGFVDFKVRAMGGWNASFAQVMGLWLKRSPMTPEARAKMAKQLWPLYTELVKTDSIPADDHAGNTLTTGWTGLAHAPAATTAAVASTAPGVVAAAPEVEPADLPLLLVRSHEFNYSETFLEDHVAHISKNLTLLYGWPFPRFVRGGKTVLTQATESAIAAALTGGGKITAELWNAYSRDVATWIRGAGLKSAILESGLMGSFLHEACEAAGLPYVVHFHGVDAFGRDLLERWQGHYRKFFTKAHRVVGVSKAMCTQLVALGAPPEKVLLAPYGVAVNLPALARPAEAPPRFVAVGRFVEKKAPLNTLKAFARVHREVLAAQLVMIGDGPLLASCQEYVAKNGLAAAVTFAGVQSRESVCAHMAAARVFVQHSITASTGDSEGLPLAILEAGAHGLPVVSTRHAGIPDAVIEGEHGFLVAENDIDGMAEAMTNLARDPALAARLGSAFRERVIAEYSRKVSIERLQRLLTEAVAAPAPRGVVERFSEELATAQAAVDAARAANDVAAEAGALQALLGLDRAQLSAYERLGDLLQESGDEPSAYLCYREAGRLGGLGAGATARLAALEAADAGKSELACTYREQIGESVIGVAETPHRILVVTNLFPPQELGGYGRTMWEFCDLLTRRGHEVKVLTSDCPEWARASDPGMDRLESKVERTLTLFGTWKGGAAALNPDRTELRKIASKNTRMIAQAVREFGPDRVIAGNLDFVGYDFIRDCLGKKIPVLHRLGNAETGYPADAVLESPYFCLAGNTDWLNRRLQDKGYRAGNWSVVYPGSPLEHYYRAFPPRFDRLRIAYASIFAPFKGPHVLFDALGHLARAGVDFTLECAGEQPDPAFKAECENAARRGGFAERIRWHGFINRAGLAAMFNRCNTLVFPSVFEEPFGKTQIEAMAAGLAVVSSGTGGTGEIVKHQVNGLLFKSKDAADLARQLQSLPRDPERWSRLASQGQADAYRFTTGESVRRIEAFFDSPFPADVAQRAALLV